MAIYIQATANISPQKTFGQTPFLPEAVAYEGTRLKSIEPDYTGCIDTKALRRMSRIVKMGVAASLECLREGQEKDPGAIITGTAFGCLQDTETFLSSLIEEHEGTLQPTPFIQSTHNTVGAQIALILKCHAYNNTFVHRGFSFETALLDACLLLEENETSTVLVGGVEETTDISHTILSRLGCYKRQPVSNLTLFTTSTEGTIAGEGAAFFLLASKPSATAYARHDGVSTFYKPKANTETEQHILSFLNSRQTDTGDVDLVILGRNGDRKNDAIYEELKKTIFKNSVCIDYKHLCGEYATSTSFALWLAAKIIRSNLIPAAVGYAGQNSQSIKKILIYNHQYNIHHSLQLVSAI